jgi:hypothetical protein
LAVVVNMSWLESDRHMTHLIQAKCRANQALMGLPPFNRGTHNKKWAEGCTCSGPATETPGAAPPRVSHRWMLTTIALPCF